MKNAKLFMVLSMATFGSIALFVKNINLPSAEIALFRSLIAIVLIGAVLCFTKRKIELKKIKKDVLLLFLSGAVMGFNWIFLFEAYNYTSVSVATLSYYFSPVLVVVFSSIFFKEKLSLKAIICFIFALIGMVLIIGLNNLTLGVGSAKGVFLGLIAALLYSIVVLLNMCIKNVADIERTFLQFLSAAVVLLPYVLFTSGINVLGLNTKGIISLLIVGIIHSGICYCLYFASIKRLKGSQVAVLSYIDPLVAVIISFLFLKEPFTLTQALGGLMILVSSFFINKKSTE